MGRASREKGARGERRCCDFFQRLGIPAYRVSSLESDRGSPVNYDVTLTGTDWKVQVKEVKKNCPALPVLMANAHVGFVHFSSGRTFVVIDADDLREFAKLVASGRSE